ncbi:condensation domain-containing protein, partial [Pyxidicoccus sp. 3LFB2]
EYLGRSDFQVKLRGFRIELGEIEAVLLRQPGLKDAVVVAREDVPGDMRLVAYVVAHQGHAPDAATLRQALKQDLPEYMVPSAFVALDALPLTSNGKLDRRALPVPESTAAALVGYVAPRTPTEELVAGVLAQVLRLERVGATGHFFELGGHSLLATQVISRLREAFGIDLPLRALFEAPTVEELSRRVDAAVRAGLGLQAPALTPAPRTGTLPLSFGQQRLWFLHQLSPDSPLYNIPAALNLEGTLDAEALRKAMHALVQRHEALRTTFVVHEGVPTQHIHPEARVELPVV